MRILLDESLPVGLAPLISGHQVATVRAVGWSGTRNGRLLALASARFDAFITADRNLEHQQNLATLPIAVVVLHLTRTRLQSIEPLIPELLRVLGDLPPRVLRRVGA